MLHLPDRRWADFECDDESVPKVKYAFVNIGNMGDLQKDQTCGEFQL